MKEFNETPREDIVLTQGSKYYVVTTYTIDDVAQDISGGAFKMNLLDKEGGTILAGGTAAYVSDGTDGQFSETVTIAELDTLIAASTIPTYYEVWFSSDGAAGNYIIWYVGRIEYRASGSA